MGHAGIPKTAFAEALRQAAEDQSYSNTSRDVDCGSAYIIIALIWMPALLRHSAMPYLADSQNTKADIRRHAANMKNNAITTGTHSHMNDSR